LLFADVDLVGRPKLRELLEASLLFLLHETCNLLTFIFRSLSILSSSFFLELLSGFLDLLGLFVAVFDLSVVVEVSHELAPRYKLLVVNVPCLLA